MSDATLILQQKNRYGQFVSPLDPSMASDGNFHNFALPATDENVYTLPTNTKAHVKTIIIANREAGTRAVRLNNAAGTQVFPTIAVLTNDTVNLTDVVGLNFTGNIHAQTDAGAIVTGISVFVGVLLEATGEEAAE